jgi:hypothetical protein
MPPASRRAAAALVAALAVLGGATQSAAADYRLLSIDGVQVKWGAPVFGAGADVSYGFAQATQRFPDAGNCRALAPMDALAPAWQNDDSRLARIAHAAFEMWGRAANLTFRPAQANEQPDILIGVQGEPRGIAFANVWHGSAAGGVAPLTQATICLNPEEAWTSDERLAARDVHDLGTVLAHEIGHAIGLDHPGPRGALMGYSNQGPMDGLMAGDVAGARLLYGPAD